MALAILLLLSACTSPNVNYIVDEINFYCPATDSIPDTLATMTKYKQSTNFTTVVFDTTVSNSSPRYGGRTFPFSNAGGDFYANDLIIKLMPSGRTYKIKDISHENGHRSDDRDVISNSFSYVVNDSIYKVPSGYSDNGYLRYAIQIKY